MNWTRLYIIVEGQTERDFAKESIAAHLAARATEVNVSIIQTNRKLGKRGGITNFAKIKNELQLRMKGDPNPDAYFTTMIDLYALPTDFPAWRDAKAKTTPIEKVQTLETAFEKEIGDSRFIPYIQLHEFETLLYCDLSELRRRITNSAAGIEALQKEVSEMSPESINDGVETAPSKRLIAHIPLYEKNKVRAGAPAAAAIGLATLRQRCPHFDNWLSRLEAISPQNVRI